MSLDLTARQRAMLCEMGLRLWQPSTAPAPVSGPAPARGVAVAAGAAALPVSAPAPAAQAAPALPPTQRSAPALGQAVASAASVSAAVVVSAPALPASGQRADWLLLSDWPLEALPSAHQTSANDADILLNNMLAALGLQRCTALDAAAPNKPERSAYLSRALQHCLGASGAPEAAALMASAQHLRQEIALLEPKLILAMGRLAMQVALSQEPPPSRQLPLGQLRGQVWRFEGVALVATYPPAYLLRNPVDKARAWADLCLAAEVVQGC